MEKINSQRDVLLFPDTEGINRGMYPIHIWWEKKYYFPSKRKALRFVAITNQFYTKMLYEARMIYIDTWIKCERAIPYLTTDTSAFDYADKRRTCRNAMHACEESLDLMNERNHWDNGHWIVRNKFNVIVNSCRQAIDALRSIYQSKSTAMDLYELDSIGRRIHILEFSIKTFGDTEARDLQKPEMHDGKISESALMAQTKLTIVA